MPRLKIGNDDKRRPHDWWYKFYDALPFHIKSSGNTIIFVAGVNQQLLQYGATISDPSVQEGWFIKFPTDADMAEFLLTWA